MAFYLFTIDSLHDSASVEKASTAFNFLTPPVDFLLQELTPQLIVKLREEENAHPPEHPEFVDTIIEALHSKGFTATFIAHPFVFVGKMKCGGCVEKIEEIAQTFDSFQAVVQLAAPQVALTFDNDVTVQKLGAELAAFIDSIEEAGFIPTFKSLEPPPERKPPGEELEEIPAYGLASDDNDDSEIYSTQVHPAFIAPHEEETPPEPTSQEDDLGHSPNTPPRRILQLEGMTCASCANTIEKALSKLPDVEHVTVNFATEEANLTLKPESHLQENDLIEVVKAAGYGVSRVVNPASPPTRRGGEMTVSPPTEPSISEKRQREAKEWKKRWISGIYLAIPIMVLQMYAVHQTKVTAFLLQGVAAYLTSAIIFYCGAPFFKNAWQSLKHKHATMDTLVALGAGTAYIFSLIQFFIALGVGTPKALYFDSAAMIISLISIGKWLEARAKGDASQQLEGLLKRAPKVAHLLHNGELSDVAVESLQLDDILLVKPGETIPVDGTVIKGDAEIDASMVTGESLPVAVAKGSHVIGGTLNKNGSIELKVTASASASMLAKIARQVERAQATKTKIQRLADKIASYFVPAVLAIAAITFVAWLATGHSLALAILPAVAVLVVACPCALGLATPTAMMVGSSWGARHGIIINNVNALERTRTIDTLVFDKTGTVTKGQFGVVEETFFDSPLSKDFLRHAIATIERMSEHPLADAIVSYIAESTDLSATIDPVENFSNLPGKGVTATIGKHTFRIGKIDWLTQDESYQPPAGVNGSSILVEVDGVISTRFTLADEIKENAADTIAKIKNHQIEPWLITGDRLATAQIVAKQLGINPDHVMAETMPEDKASKIKMLIDKGHHVAMVGDGINDGPALAEATLGIAMGTGSDVAMETADITLLSGDLDLIIAAIGISSATHKKIKENLFWAFFYNLLLIPVAAFGFLEPIYAALAMSLSSFFVVTNSLLLRRYQPKSPETKALESKT